MKRPAASVLHRPAASSSKRRKVATAQELEGDKRIAGGAKIPDNDCDWLRTNWPSLINFKSTCGRVVQYVHGLLKHGFRNETKAKVSANSQLDTRTCDKVGKMAAHVLLTFDRECRRRCEYGFAMQQEEVPLQYLDIDGSDESPFPLARTDDLPNEQLQMLGQSGDMPEDKIVALFKEAGRPSKAVVAPTKVLQSKSRYSMLSRNKLSGKYTIMGGNTLNPLMHIERTTAECYFQAWRARTGVSAACNRFDDCVRVVPEDGAPSNFRNERQILSYLGPTWSGIEIQCEDHLQALGLGAFSKVIDGDITGQIHWSLMHSDGTARIHTKRILKEVVFEWVEIQRGPPPSDARSRMQILLRMCFQGCSNRTMSTILRMCYLPNGDPHIHGRIDIWVPHGIAVDLGAIKFAVWKTLDTLFLDTCFQAIKRHRWRGLFPGLSKAALLFNLWGIGKEVSKRLAVQMQRISSRQRSRASASSSHAMGGDHTEQSSDMAQETERHRQIGGEWIDTNPGPRCLVARMAVEPLRAYQEQHTALRCRRASDKRDINQAINMDNVALKDAMPFYKIVSGDLELDAFERLEVLLTDERMWKDLIPSESKTMELQALAFRLIMSSGSLLEHNIHSRRHRQPMATFQRDIRETGSDSEIMPECRHTKWSLEHHKKHIDVDDTDLEALADGKAKRVQIAREANTSIDDIESQHASIRRRLRSRGQQTCPVTFLDLNVNWIFDRARCHNLHHSWRLPDDFEAKADASVYDSLHDIVSDPDSDFDGTDEPQRRGGGGVFRAYVRERTVNTHQGRPDLMQIGSDYRRDKEAIRGWLAEIGAVATAAHAAGSARSFGPTGRDIQRALASNQLRASLEQARDTAAIVPATHSGIGDDALRHALAVASSTDDMLEGVRAGKLFIRTRRAVLQAQRREDLMALQRWTNTDGQRMISSFVGAFPSMVHIRDHLVAIPFGGADVIEVVPKLQQIVVATAAIQHSAPHTKVAASFAQRFHGWSECIMHDAIPPFDDGHARNRAKASFRPCGTASMCLCSEDKQDTWKLRNSLLKSFKLACPVDSNQRKLLSERKIVIRLTGNKDAVANVWAKRRLLDAGMSVDPFHSELWYVVATMIFSPYMPVFYEMLRRVAQPATTPHGTIALQAARQRWIDHYAVAHRLRKDVEWKIEFYVLHESKQRLIDFVPGNQYVSTLCGPSQLWPPLKIARPGGGAGDGFDEDEGAPDIVGAIADEHVCLDAALALEGVDPPPDPIDAAAASGHAALAVVQVGPHSISFYRDGRFEAVCRREHHESIHRCRLTRTSFGSDDTPEQGRPLGLLMAWLIWHEDVGVAEPSDRDEHLCIFNIFALRHDVRVRAREALATIDGGVLLLSKERRRRPGEPDEPEGFP